MRVSPVLLALDNQAPCPAQLENLSANGLMCRAGADFPVNQRLALSFCFEWSPPIELWAQVVSRVGALYGVRFDAAPLSEPLIQAMIGVALKRGDAASATVHDVGGRRVLRLMGGLWDSLAPDIAHFLARGGVDALDAQAVTAVETAGMAPCLEALASGQLELIAESTVFAQYRHTAGVV